jgi:monofunctional glycosyltransferase
VVLRQEVPSGGSGLAGSRPSLIMVGVRRWSGRIAKLVLVALVAVVGLMLLYRFVDPPTTPTLAWRAVKGEPIDQRWVPIEQISPRLVQAVIASEDARFCEHWGIDFAQLRAAIEETRDGNPRGASTITMQVTKNLFLWLERSYLRKAIELPLALILDFVMPKRRTMEIYLNIAEWAPGVYGAEAAAQHHFGRSAARLTSTEAARLAVTLPAPSLRDAGAPRARHQRLSELIATRVRRGVDTSCVAR